MKLSFVKRRWAAIAIPAIVGYGAAWLCVYGVARYGVVLFVALPLLVSFLSAFWHGFTPDRRLRSAYGTAVLSMLTLGGMIFLTAMDGLFCLVLALPLALVVGLVGAALGHLAGREMERKSASSAPLILCLMFPCLVAFEDTVSDKTALRSVTTALPIHASPQQVWDVVVAFPRITTPPEGLFRCGVACPLAAHIDGVGIGATRHCTFTTGSFVEPITAWRPGELLAFDVSSSPAPMEEFSIYDHIEPPHLHGHLQSRRGQFRITRAGDVTVLEGTTWYDHQMWPQWYWGPVTDHIVHRIHDRVLQHIRLTAEREAGK